MNPTAEKMVDLRGATDNARLKFEQDHSRQSRWFIGALTCERNFTDARIRELENALKKVPILRLSTDKLSWVCAGCGMRSGMTPDGKELHEKCLPDCYVAAVECALDSTRV